MSKYIDPEFIGNIIDIFDDFLEEKGIQIPNPEKEESDSPAVFYGSDYGAVQNELESLIHAWSEGNIIRPFIDDKGNKLGADELRVDTEAGRIIARINTDEGAPGINVAFAPKTVPEEYEEYDMVYIEQKKNANYRMEDEDGSEVLMYVYGSERDEYTDKIRYNADGTVRRT